MSIKVNALDIGPVLGYTTPDSMKVWGRSKLTDGVGIVEIKPIDSDDTLTETFEFNASLDYTGVVGVSGIRQRLNMQLNNDAVMYRVGCINRSDIPLIADLNWDDIDFIQTKLAPADENSFNFVFGSCRHLDIGFFDNKFDERCFDVIANKKHDYQGDDPDFMLFLGDQVYADHNEKWFFQLFRKRALQKESHYQSHYHKSWGRDCFSTVVSKFPSLMMWDDHEVLNDWDVDKIKSKKWKKTAFKNGEKYFRAYQAALNPDTYDDAFYYSFEYGMGDFFVMDVRSDKSPSNHKLIGQAQKDRFEAWLNNQSNKIKFIASPVPITPDAYTDHIGNGSKDRWDVFPNERKWLFECIEEYQKENPDRPVIILSGDVHCSYGVQIINTVDVNSPLKLYQLVSSGFHWPVPGLTQEHFIFNEPLKVDGDFHSKLNTQFIGGEDKVIVSHNFCHVSVDGEQVNATWYSEHGRKLHSVNIKVS